MIRTLLLAAAFFLLAGSEAAPAETQPDVAGSGPLIARGDGLVMFAGSGTVAFRCTGFIMVSSTAEIEVEDGSPLAFDIEDGEYRYWEVDGKATVYGEDIEVTCGGASIVVKTRACGTVRLIGAGYYRLGSHVGTWRAEGETIEITGSEDG